MRIIVLSFVFLYTSWVCAYDYDVVVIGAGPSGLSAAVAAARAGAKVLVLEKRGEDWGSRQRLVGVDREAIQDAQVLAGRPIPFAWIENFVAFTEFGRQSVSAGRTSSLGLGLILNREFGGAIPIGEFERRMLNAARELGVTVQFESEAVQIQPRAVTFKLKDQTQQTLQSRYIVLATGKRRDLLYPHGFEVQGLGLPESTWLVANFKADAEAGNYLIETRNMRDHPYIGLTLSWNGTASVYARHHEGRPRGDFAQIVKESARRVGISPLGYENDVSEFTNRPDRLNRFSDASTGVLVVGDAARKGEPYSGIGVTLAVRDAVLLRRFFESALGASEDGLLMAGYDREMEKSVTKMVAQARKFDGLRALFTSDNSTAKLGFTLATRAASLLSACERVVKGRR